jgi:hypothetical protein
VIRNQVRDANDDPFPTRYWLVCPEAVKAVSRVESGGAIGELNDRVQVDEPWDADDEIVPLDLVEVPEGLPAGADPRLEAR